MSGIVTIAVLVSGSGSNLQSLIDHIDRGLLDARIGVVISNNAGAYALERAKKHGIPGIVVDHAAYPTRGDFDRAILAALRSYPVDLIVLAGFMRVLGDVVLDAFPLRVMNIHPALLPAFPGLYVQQQALDYGVKFSGCTVHFVDKGVDTGPIIMQGIVPVYDDDDADSLAGRILREEHRIYPQAIQFYAEGRLEVVGRRVCLRNGGRASIAALHNPPLTSF